MNPRPDLAFSEKRLVPAALKPILKIESDRLKRNCHVVEAILNKWSNVAPCELVNPENIVLNYMDHLVKNHRVCRGQRNLGIAYQNDIPKSDRRPNTKVERNRLTCILELFVKRRIFDKWHSSNSRPIKCLIGKKSMESSPRGVRQQIGM